MSILLSRTAIIPVWLVVFGLFALSGSPMPFAAGMVLLVAVGVALTIMFARWNEVPPVATLPSADFAPNSWPNSGFRNSRQRGTGGGRRDPGTR